MRKHVAQAVRECGTQVFVAARSCSDQALCFDAGVQADVMATRSDDPLATDHAAAYEACFITDSVCRESASQPR
jgi:hypothetical protein